ncbi:hypothetical protein [Chitinophaga defluvii]|uniref:Uncharacterized protein n=1 Tax=Chitinophaga defluvii TaxID=3163343 RepID=A0ABV2TCA7_9BACT
MPNSTSRYDFIRPLVEIGNVTSLQEIFMRKLIPITQFINDTGSRYATMHDKIYNPGNLKLEDFIIIGNLFDLTPEQVVTLALKDMKKHSKTSKPAVKKTAAKPSTRKT